MIKINDETMVPRRRANGNADSDNGGGGNVAAAAEEAPSTAVMAMEGVEPDSRDNSQNLAHHDDEHHHHGAENGLDSGVSIGAAGALESGKVQVVESSSSVEKKQADTAEADDDEREVTPDSAAMPPPQAAAPGQPKAKKPPPPQDKKKLDEDADTTSSSSNAAVEPQPPPRKPISSNDRADSFRHHGLSELSKQLRVLQAKNVSQSNDIDRLERQLQILADLKGVSVSDLRSALSAACEGEAHADLRSQVCKLRAELDAAALTNRPVNKRGGAASVQEESTNRTIADLQLRVGELEEVEEALRAELRDLYENLGEQTARATGLASKLAFKEVQVEELLKSLKLADNKRLEADSLRVDRETSEAKIDGLTDKLRTAELEVQIERDKARLLQDQVDAREKEAQLRAEQAKSRATVQDERIHDLEQQLSSLYVAFEMLQQERSVETERRSELESYLNNADSEVARQLNTVEGVESRTTRTALATPSPASTVDRASSTSLPDPPATPAQMLQTPGSSQASSVVAVGTPVQATPVAVAVPSPAAAAAAASSEHGVPVGTRVTLNQLNGTPEHNGRRGVVVSTPEGEDGQQIVFLEDVDVTLSAGPLNMTPDPPAPKVAAAPSPKVLASGFLLKRENKVLKGWKKRFFVLRGSYGIYQLSWADGPRQRAKGTIGIATGVSSVTRTKQFFPSQKYAFVLHVNRQAAKAPILCAAASSEEELKKWLSALLMVTKGDLQDLSEGTLGGQQEVDDHAIALRMQSMEFS